MSCCCGSFQKTLQYVSPAHGGWGVIRIAALVPESYQLFVAPFACGRHGALGGEINGIKDRISYLYIDESDIVSGHYEDLIPDAVEELFESLEKRPKVLLLFVSCLDDLLGTDHEQLNKRLSKLYPDVEFRSCHMNPISTDTKFPPGVTLQNTLYSLLPESDTKENAINLIGNNVDIHKDCELYEIMGDASYKVNHMTKFDTFEGFGTMSKSKLNVVLAPVAKYASTVMKERLGIEPFVAYPTYNLDEIEEFYKELSSILGIQIEYQKYKREAEQSIKEALRKIGDQPIAIDYQAVRKPFTLAKTLIQYGFHVGLVMSDDIKPFEKEAYDYLVEHCKEVKILNAIHPEMINLDKTQKYLCIGYDCGYATDSNKVIKLFEDEGLYGFYGIKALMNMMVAANENEVNLHEVIEEAGLIV